MKILICGAGIAGLTAAYWLNHYGFDVDIIEKADNYDHRLGYVVDFWGAGFSVAEKMQLLEKLRSQHYPLNSFIFINDAAVEVARFSIPQFRRVHADRIVTILHGDLEKSLLALLPSTINIRYGMTVDRLINTPDKITAYFSDKTSAIYDLVIGADGVHSRIRSLIFGDESEFAIDLGYQLTAMIQPNNVKIDDSLYTYSALDRQVAVCPIRDNQLATFFIYRESAQTKSMHFSEVFKTDGWIIPALLENMSQTKDIFSDRLVQIQMPSWHQHRVVLIGDACHCLTLMSGQGASMAMAGAYILATQLRQHADQPSIALTTYEAIMKSGIAHKQAGAREFLSQFIPNKQSHPFNRRFFTRQFFKNMYQISEIEAFCKK